MRGDKLKGIGNKGQEEKGRMEDRVRGKASCLNGNEAGCSEITLSLSVSFPAVCHCPGSSKPKPTASLYDSLCYKPTDCSILHMSFLFTSFINCINLFKTPLDECTRWIFGKMCTEIFDDFFSAVAFMKLRQAFMHL